jgi:hypothetical protein
VPRCVGRIIVVIYRSFVFTVTVSIVAYVKTCEGVLGVKMSTSKQLLVYTFNFTEVYSAPMLQMAYGQPLTTYEYHTVHFLHALLSRIKQ